jgi:hypothetical protein
VSYSLHVPRSKLCKTSACVQDVCSVVGTYCLNIHPNMLLCMPLITERVTTGRITCPAAIGAAGAAVIPNFPIPSLKYRATDITLAAGVGQEYTLCFQTGMWINYANMCIAPTGVCTVTAEARPAGTIVVDPVATVTPTTTPVVAPVTPTATPAVPPVTPVVPITGQVSIPTVAAGGAANTVSSNTLTTLSACGMAFLRTACDHNLM